MTTPQPRQGLPAGPPARRGNHPLAPLRGRDPHEKGRAASPLELLFDLSFAVAFSVSGTQFAHAIAEAHLTQGLIGFFFSCFAIVWAWINFSWFASAYDTDDWGFRLMAMVIMVGVVITALGMPALYESIVGGEHFDNQTMVLGYVVMRVALLVGWVRAYRSDAERRPTIRSYVITLIIAQAGWTAVALLPVSLGQALAVGAVLYLIELGGPYLAERKVGTPWHAHHITERYSLLAIITLGEGIIGTVAALAPLTSGEHWSPDAVPVIIAGIGLTFGLWWVYFSWDAAEILHHFRQRSFAFGYLHLPLYASIAAVGAGLHVAGYWLDHHADVSAAGAAASVAIPVGLYVVLVFAIYYALHRGAAGGHGAFHALLLGSSLAVIASGVVLAAFGVSLGICLLVVMAGPFVAVIGQEILGHRHMNADLESLLPSERRALAGE